MRKICSVCGYQCEDNAVICPVCDSPLSERAASAVPPLTPAQPEAAQSQTTQPQIMQSQAAQPQATQSQATQPQIMQSQAAQSQATQSQAAQPQATQPQIMQSQAAQSQAAQPQTNAPQYTSPSYTGNGSYPPAYNQPLNGQPVSPVPPAPAKKSHKTLGIVGGVLLLLLILALIISLALRGVRNRYGQSGGTNTVGIPSDVDYQEYYYPDYTGSDLNSEAFTDITTTEAPATESTEAPSVSENTDAWREEDLTLYAAGTDPSISSNAIALEYDSMYTVTNTGIYKLQQSGEQSEYNTVQAAQPSAGFEKNCPSQEEI